MNKVLTIVVPVYNTEKYIKRCLDSIVCPSIIDDLEIIIVSDGSTDSSVCIAKEFQNQYPKSIKIIEKENGGHGSTINVGLKMASGKYFRVLDSDDWFNTIDFIDFVNYLKYDDVDLVVTNYSQEHIYNGESIQYKYSGLWDNEVYDFDAIDLKLLKNEYFVMATSTYKTDLLKKADLKLLEKTFYVDMQYNVVGFSLVKKFKYYNLDVYKYFICRKEQSNNYMSLVKNQDNHEIVMRFLIEYYCSNYKSFSKNKNEYFSLIIYYMLYTHYSIYCIYDSNHNSAYNKIKNFDNYLKKKSVFLYEKSNISFIKVNRKTKFIFVKLNGKLFNKFLNFIKFLRR